MWYSYVSLMQDALEMKGWQINMEILLPKTIIILKHCHNMTMSEKCKGFSIFFENIIYPLKQEYDVIVDCKFRKCYKSTLRLCTS